MLPNLEKLEADIARIERLKGFPLGRILGSTALSELAVSRNRSILAKVMRSRFVEIDWRIRFVEGVAGGVPKGTMKLFSVGKAVTAPSGHRIWPCWTEVSWPFHLRRGAFLGIGACPQYAVFCPKVMNWKDTNKISIVY